MGSGAARWPLLARLSGREARLGAWALRHGTAASFGYEFLRFGIKQGWACLFGGLLLGLIVATRLVWPQGAPLARYDFLVIACLALQAGLLVLRLETLEEAKVILAFHVIGTVMELFKTSVGSWHYPEASVLRIGDVPLFSGFMYGAVGSYLARVWRLFDFRFTRHPPLSWMAALSVGVYANFFLDHWGFDARYVLLAAAAAMFLRTTVHFRVWVTHRSMPLPLGFGLVALFIWFGENIATAGGAWLYPAQARAWTMVPVAKLSSWLLLMLVSYTLVAFSVRRAGGARDVAAGGCGRREAGRQQGRAPPPPPFQRSRRIVGTFGGSARTRKGPEALRSRDLDKCLLKASPERGPGAELTKGSDGPLGPLEWPAEGEPLALLPP